MLDCQRRNWAMLVEANKVWNETAHALARRQMGVARQTMQDFAALVEESWRKPGTFEDRIGKGAVYTRHTVQGFCDLAEHATKSGAEIVRLFNRRMSETLEDAGGTAKRAPPQAVSSPPTHAAAV